MHVSTVVQSADPDRRGPVHEIVSICASLIVLLYFVRGLCVVRYCLHSCCVRAVPYVRALPALPGHHAARKQESVDSRIG